VVVAVGAGGGLSSVSPGRPIKYPAIPDPSMSATTTALSVDLFMRTPANATELYAADCANTVESDGTVEILPLLLRAYHA
jgi:predicted solute-binding protein